MDIQPEPSLSGVRVLVVDDDDDGRDMVATVLRSIGAEVVCAASAAEAMAELRRHRPHVLLADIEMPVENGYTLLGRVRALPADEGGLTPAAALTAYASEADRTAALKAGFQTHVPKPVLPADLVRVVMDLKASL